MAAGATYTPIASQTLSASASEILFSNIPQGYTDLIVIVQGRFDSANTIREIGFRFNGDSGTNYSSTRIIGDGSTASSDRLTNFNNMRFGVLPAASATASELGNAIFHLQNYSNSTTYKTVLNRTNYAGTGGWTVASVGLWRNTAAITSLRIAISETQTGNFVSGSTFTLYGITAA